MSNLITAEVLEILAEIEESVGDVLDAKTMPRDAYVSKAFYEFEKEAVFARSWMCLGRADTVKEPGDYVRIDIDTEPLIIVRDSERNVPRSVSSLCTSRALGYGWGWELWQIIQMPSTWLDLWPRWDIPGSTLHGPNCISGAIESRGYQVVRVTG